MRFHWAAGVSLALLGWTAVASAQETIQPTTPKEPATAEPYIIEGGGVSFEPWYWLATATPRVREGSLSATKEPGDLDLPGKTKLAAGFVFSVPAGKQNTLRLSYFRAGGSGDTVAGTDLALFSVGYKAGDPLRTKFRLHNAKLSWDYLSYTFANGLRLKTFWETQVSSIETTIDAPLKAGNIAIGSKWVVLPTFGLGLGHAPARHFRWELKGTGFGIPGRSATWDVEGAAFLRLGSMELIGGHKAFFLRTSPREEAYFKHTLSGAYAGIRWYWDTRR